MGLVLVVSRVILTNPMGVELGKQCRFRLTSSRCLVVRDG